MSIDVPTLRVVHSGLVAPGQTWSTSHWIAPLLIDGHPTPSDLGSIAAATATAAKTWFDHVANNWGANTTANKSTCYFYAAGSSGATAMGEYAWPTPTPGGGSAGFTPLTTSMVVSERTAVPGRSGRGRMYVPYNSGGIGSNGHFSSGNVDAMAGWAKAYMDTMNSVDLSSYGFTNQRCCVASHTKGHIYDITTLVVDDVPDNQSRRKDKVSSAHTASVALA